LVCLLSWFCLCPGETLERVNQRQRAACDKFGTQFSRSLALYCWSPTFSLHHQQCALSPAIGHSESFLQCTPQQLWPCGEDTQAASKLVAHWSPASPWKHICRAPQTLYSQVFRLATTWLRS
jgi:hypothetical protein